MCYIDEYTCAFREYYYKGTYSIEESKEIRKLYFTKLPEPFNSKVIKSWNEAELTDTLGARIKFLQRWFMELCEKHIDLSVAKIFEIPTVRNWFKRQKEEYYVVSQREHIIDCKYTKGKAKIPIINKRIINKEIQDIKAKNPIKYVH